jgi:ribosomal-protein-alanine N-acetyltransferase
MAKINFSSFPTLKTDRLVLRKLVKSDAETVFALRTDKDINKFIERPPERQEKNGLEFITRIDKGLANNSFVNWAISYKSESKLLGTICLWNFSEDKKIAEVGYNLIMQQHGKGIMSEALKAVLDYGFNTLNFETIEAFTHKNNTASVNLLLKQDFKCDDKRKDDDNKNNLIFIKHKN